MRRPLLERILQPIVKVQRGEAITALLMFTCSFLAMTSYNILKPITRSKFITDLGADNIPYVPLAAGILFGFIMSGYAYVTSRLPRRWCLQIWQLIVAAVLVAFWLVFPTGGKWVSVAFYLFGLIFGLLVISQFWTLANVVYDARQAKRLFGFIGGGAPLGGIAGSLILTNLASRFGTLNLLLVSAGVLVLSAGLITIVTLRTGVEGQMAVEQEKGIGIRRPIQLLRGSRHLQIVALVISFAALGAALIDQQLNMATEASKGRQATDAMTAFLGTVQLWTSTIGFLVQVLLTSRVHRFMGIGFALLVLPVSLGATGCVVLAAGALWAPALARVFDQSLRYNLDKTTREILYMPLPPEIKYEAKSFVDVTVDRFAKGVGAVLLLVLIKPWGLHLSWWQVSYASIAIMGVWLAVAVWAKRGYREAFRANLRTQEVRPADLRLPSADLSTIETLIEELASPDEHRVLYAIDLLESLAKRNLVTPLLLYHESPAVRLRALNVLAAAGRDGSARWLPVIERMITDADADVRTAAVAALAKIHDQRVADLVRPYLDSDDTRLAMTAALVLASNGYADDAAAAEERLRALVSDDRESAAPARRDLATALGRLQDDRLRPLLIPLLSDPHLPVAEEAMRSVKRIGASDFLFVPTLVALLRDRRLRDHARDALVGYGEPVLDSLRFFLREPDEQIWVRRHLPAAIARIPCQAAMDILVDALGERDSFLRFKTIEAIEYLHRSHPGLTYDASRLEQLALEEASRGMAAHQLCRRLFADGGCAPSSLLAQALTEKASRIHDRVFRLLALMHPSHDIPAARWGIEHGDPRARAGAIEYLDNLLKGAQRKRLVPFIEAHRVAAAISAQPAPAGRAVDDRALREAIDHPDAVVSASALILVEQMQRHALADHVEHVLATRDVRDWYVFEAASWVLGAFRLSDQRRRALWLEPLPAAEVASQLRALPLFSAVPAHELFRIAGAGRQVRYEPGRVLYNEGAQPTEIQFLLNGAGTAATRVGELALQSAPAVFAFEEAVAGRAMRATIRTQTNAVCLSLGTDDLRTLLADNTNLVRRLFGTLIACEPHTMPHLVVKGEPSASPPGVVTPLKAIDRVLSLQAVPLLSSIAADEMLRVAAIAHEVPLVAGSTLFKETDAASLHVLVAGQLELRSPTEAPALAAPGDAVGVCETLAGVALARSGYVLRDGFALRIDRDELFDLLGQRTELLRQLFAAIFRVRPLGGAALT